MKNASRIFQPMFADDTNLFYCHKNIRPLFRNVNQELKQIHTCSNANKLSIRLSKTNIVFSIRPITMIVCGLNVVVCGLNVFYRGTLINFTTRYKYLGTTIVSNVNVNDHFDNIYKKASGRLRLLSRLRFNLTVSAAENVYNMMIVQLLMFNGILNLKLTATQERKLTSLENRAKAVIYDRKKYESEISKLKDLLYIHACCMVKTVFTETRVKTLKTISLLTIIGSMHEITVI